MIQVFGCDLLDGKSDDDVSALRESVTSKYGEMSVIKAGIELQEHGEQSRGASLLLARIRLATDGGHCTADGEGYGASHALRLAANGVERQILNGRTYGQSKKQPENQERERLCGWWLGGQANRSVVAGENLRRDHGTEHAGNGIDSGPALRYYNYSTG